MHAGTFKDIYGVVSIFKKKYISIPIVNSFYVIFQFFVKIVFAKLKMQMSGKT